MLLVLVGGVMQANAQRETAGTIRVAFADPTSKWQQSHFYIYVFGTSTDKNDAWPGIDVTSNTLTIDGKTYYYRDFPITEYGVGFKVIAVNDDGNGNSQSQSEDLTWCYDRSAITGDTYFKLKDEWDNSNHRKAELKEVYYIADYDNSSKILMTTQSGNNYTAKFNTIDFPKYVVANSYAFNDNGLLDFTQNSGYPANIYRPNYENTLAFANISHNVSDSQRTEFYKWHNAGFWNASALKDITLDMSFTIDNWSPTTYSINPYFERTIPANSYATFSSEYDVAIPDGVTAYYATGATVGRVTVTPIANGIPSTQAAMLYKENGGLVTFTPAETVEGSTTNLLVKGTTAGVPATDVNNSKYRYVFGTQGGVLAFYNVADAIDQDMTGKAYLETGVNIQPTNAPVLVSFGDDATDIRSIGNVVKDNVYYDLSGRSVMNPTKGLYIVNGKKVIIK